MTSLPHPVKINLMAKLPFLLLKISLISLISLISPSPLSAEAKPPQSTIIPKLPQTPNDPILRNGGVYPLWGPVCQRYTYFTYYQDQEGRPPEYVRLWFNGQWLDVEKENPNDNDYQKGVKYIYQFVPHKLDANFFFFEASNGLGKTREGIIDSPGNGPVLFEGDFLDNEIAVIAKNTQQKILTFPTAEEWVGGVSLSDDGRYLAAKTSRHVYLFDTQNPQKPLWDYSLHQAGPIGGDVKGGVAISGDGRKIFASLGDTVLLFKQDSNQPLWQYHVGNAYNVAISADGQYVAAATAGEESDLNSNLIILWQTKNRQPLWQYHASSNFHDVSLSADGSFLAGATGCPDRRAYIFSKDSNQPLLRSEMLTYDSPVSRSKITADGSLAAFNTDGGPNSSLVVLFSQDSSEPLWRFTEANQSSSRALSITPDGRFLAVANIQGDIFLFGKENNTPLTQWQLNTNIGTLDLAHDASFLAVGGTDNQVHLLDVASKKDTPVKFSEFVEEIDISANGQYIAAGTGGSVYFFESFNQDQKTYPCPTIIEPPPMSQMMAAYGSDSGNGRQPQPTTYDVEEKSIKLPGMLFGFTFLGSLALLATYFSLAKFNLLRRQNPLQLNKVIVIILSLLALLFFSLTLIAVFFNQSQNSKTPTSSPKPLPEEPPTEAICGNTLCEPDFGESKTTCPQDCSANP